MHRSAFAIAVLLSLVLAGPGCKKKPPPAPPPPPPQPVEIRLQVTSISPSTIAPDTPTKAKVFGSAFEDGATVVFSGPSEAAGTNVVLEGTNAINVAIPPLAAGIYDVRVTNPTGESSTLRQGLTVRNFESSCSRVTVQFDFDRSSLRSDAKSTLDSNMSCYQQLTGTVRVEGHADERGTTDYNLALGQRRSDAVKSYLVSNGVANSRVTTTSYGEERPIDPASNEAAWAKNRRAELTATE
jgi:peptidoglycan-associated lipoprotein